MPKRKAKAKHWEESDEGEVMPMPKGGLGGDDDAEEKPKGYTGPVIAAPLLLVGVLIPYIWGSFVAPKELFDLLPENLREYAFYIWGGGLCIGALFVLIVGAGILRLRFGGKKHK